MAEQVGKECGRMTEMMQYSPEEMAEQVRLLAEQLKMAGRKDLLLRAIGAPLLEELRIESSRNLGSTAKN